MFPILIGSKKNKEKGIFLAEILIVSAIISTALITFLGISIFSLKTSNFIKETNMAVSFSEEMIEGVRSFRDGTDWSVGGLGSLSTDIDYHLEISGSPASWSLVPGAETTNNFTKRIIIERTSRDSGTDNIEDSYNPANDDPDTRKVTANVSWNNKDLEITTYFTNWK